MPRRVGLEWKNEGFYTRDQNLGLWDVNVQKQFTMEIFHGLPTKLFRNNLHSRM